MILGTYIVNLANVNVSYNYWNLQNIFEDVEEVTQMGMIIKFLKKKINIWKILGWMKQMWLK